MVPSPWGLLPETGHIKKPRPDGGVFGIGLAVDLSRASISGPREGTFFRRQNCARIRDHVSMMMGRQRVVNPRTVDDTFVLEMKISEADEPGAEIICR
jgi:hypothetical protein